MPRHLPPDCEGCGKVEPERMQRIIVAVLQNISNWEDRLAEIERAATPGDKQRILALMKDVHFARLALRRLVKLGTDDDTGTL